MGTKTVIMIHPRDVYIPRRRASQTHPIPEPSFLPPSISLLHCYREVMDRETPSQDQVREPRKEVQVARGALVREPVMAHGASSPSSCLELEPEARKPELELPPEE